METMEYKGKLYGKIGNKYFDTSKKSNDYDLLEKQVEQLKAQADDVAELKKKLLIATDILENVQLHFESELHDLHDRVWRDSEETILEKTINFLTD